MALTIGHKGASWGERFAIGSLLVLVVFFAQLTMWKESDLFWLNLGGYPLWLRECVRTLYYPYLLFLLALVLIITRSALARFFRDSKYRKLWSLLVLAWVVLSGSIGLLVANNVINLLESRPLHYNSGDEPNHAR
jgi:hypothetical protein